MTFNRQTKIILESLNLINNDSRKSITKHNIRVGDILVWVDKFNEVNKSEVSEIIEHKDRLGYVRFYSYWCNEGPLELSSADINWKETNKLYLLRKKFAPKDRNDAMDLLDI